MAVNLPDWLKRQKWLMNKWFLMGIGLVTIALTTFCVLYFVVWNSSPDYMRVTNVTASSFTVSWVTSKPDKGMVIVREDDNFRVGIFAPGGTKIFYDDRDAYNAEIESAFNNAVNADNEGGLTVSADNAKIDYEVKEMGTYYTHHVTVSGLDNEKEYYFMVGNGVRWYGKEAVAEGEDDYTAMTTNNKIPSVKTFKELDDFYAPDPSYGFVAENDKYVPAIDVLVYSYVEGSNGKTLPLSAVTTDAYGTWAMDITTARYKDGTQLAGYTDSTKQTLQAVFRWKNEIYHGSAEITTGTNAPSNTLILNSVVDSTTMSPWNTFVSLLPVDKVYAKEIEEVELGPEPAYRADAGDSTGSATTPETTGGNIPEAYDSGRNDDTTAPTPANGSTLWYSGQHNVPEPATNDDDTPPQEPAAGSDGSLVEVEANANVYFGSSVGSDGTVSTTASGMVQVTSCLVETPEGCVVQTSGSINPNVTTTVSPLAAMTAAEPTITAVLLDASGAAQNISEASGAAAEKVDEIKKGIQTGFLTVASGSDETVEAIENFSTPSESMSQALNSQKSNEAEAWSEFTSGSANVGDINGDGVISNAENLGSVAESVGVLGSAIGESAKTACYTAASAATNVATWPADAAKSALTTTVMAIDIAALYGANIMELDTNLEKGIDYVGDVAENTTVLADYLMVKILGVKASSSPNSLVETIHAADKVVETNEKGIIIFAGKGEFNVIPEGYATTTDSSITLADNEIGAVVLFVDANSNGKFDEGESFLEDPGTKIGLREQEEGFAIEITEGYNFVSFPFVATDMTTAEGLVATLSKSGCDATVVGRFDGGWEVYDQRSADIKTNNFAIVPGEGYAIRNYKACTLNVTGRKVSEAVPLTIKQSWNLVGVHGLTNYEGYTADDVLASMKGQGIQAEIVTQWIRGRYESRIIKSVEGSERRFGQDFEINEFKAYFIQSTTEGTWDPSK